jgi:Zn-dependent protease/CBS domain-containing protein
VVDGQDQRTSQSKPGGIPLGSILGIPVRVNVSWLLIAIVITVGLQPYVANQFPALGGGTYLISGLFAVLLYGSVLLHELSHAVTARRMGLPVRGITLHILGGYTEMTEEPATPAREVAVSGSGPVVSVLVGVAGWLAAQVMDPNVSRFLLLELAYANLVVGLFNLLPALPLDGGHLLRALVWRLTGDRYQGTIVAAWGGRVLAGLVVLVPWVLAQGRPGLFGVIWAILVAAFLWSGSSQALAWAQLRRRLPGLDARVLARTALPVLADLPLAEAVRQAQAAGAGGLVVVDTGGRPRGLVNEAAVVATPEERRPWVPVGTLARSLEPGLVLPVTLAGEDLVRALQSLPATEYLVVDPDGTPVGVLVTADVEAALSAA